MRGRSLWDSSRGRRVGASVKPPRRLPAFGVVTGLAAEARIAAKFGMPVAVGGGTPEGARQAAESLVRQGVRGLVSFGLAGGLDPALAPGAILIPDSVLCSGATWPTDRRLAAELGGCTAGLLFSGEAIAADRQAKATQRQATGAAAIDLESGAVAAVAARHRLPFAVLRAICDPAGRDLPPAALLALGPGGKVRLGAVLLSVLRRPSQVGALLTLARDAKAANRALLSVTIRFGKPPQRTHS
jgi:adenosylhomocysteine nucleosidase